MEREIGEIFDYKGTRLKVVKHRGCANCFFGHGDYECEVERSIAGECSIAHRNDSTSVIFQEVSDCKRIRKHIKFNFK